MTCVGKKYVHAVGSSKKNHVPLGCFMCKKITRRLGYLVLIMRLGAKIISAKNEEQVRFHGGYMQHIQRLYLREPFLGFKGRHHPGWL